jgi:hypothetical protein
MYGVKQRCDLENTKDCVWVEIPIRGNFCSLTGNNYFAPDFNANIFENKLNFLELFLNQQNQKVNMLCDVNEPEFDSCYGTPLLNLIIIMYSCFLGPD